MLYLLAEPECLAVVDVSADPAPALDGFVEANDLHERVHRYWATDQSDGRALAEVIDRSFGDEPLDLVIDDASHQLWPTRASFARAFPHLRPGGIYVIEQSESSQRVPGFWKLPVLGNAFRNFDNEDRRRELLIFVTPSVVTQAGAVGG